MPTCKEQRQDLALLSANALDDSAKTTVLDHVEQCAGCRAYWQQLQDIARFLNEEAERSIQPARAPQFERIERETQLLVWPRAVAFALGLLVLCAAPLVLRKPAREAPIPSAAARRPAPVAVPKIADARRLVNDLDALAEAPHQGPGFVFSVGTRHEGP